MRILYFMVMLALAAAPSAVLASSSSKFFPPSNKDACGLRASILSWYGEGNDVECLDGQTFLRNTIECADGQSVVKSGSQFVCKSPIELPACAANEVLTFDGTAYTCVHSDIPTCPSDQVLSYNGTGFICVTKSASIPTCAADQFLTYNGTSFQCANTQKLTLPVCSSNQMVVSDGTSLKCAAVPMPDFSHGTVYNNSDIYTNVLTTPKPYSLCVLSVSGVASCGRCVVSRNGNGTWSLDQASCNPGIPNLSYQWCAMTCY